MHNPNIKLLLGLNDYYAKNLRWLLRLVQADLARDDDGGNLNHDDWAGEFLKELEQGMHLAEIPFTKDTRGRSWDPPVLMGRTDPLSPDKKVFAILPIDYFNRVKEMVMAKKQVTGGRMDATQAKSAIAGSGHLDAAQLDAIEGGDPSALPGVWAVLLALASSPEALAFFKLLLSKVFPVTPKA